uniref:Uncharacterized protein n=1 Tax=Xenopus tropicalis TaxID=8364 RepID=A0A1B8Y4L0_XENTR
MAAAQPLYELKELLGASASSGNFVDGKFLSVEEVYNCLMNKPIGLNNAGQTMSRYLGKTLGDPYLKLGMALPVTTLRHVTTERPTREILASESFKTQNWSNLPWKHPNARLSYWSIQVPPESTERACLKAFQDLVPPEGSKDLEKYFNRQFANSPAFNSASCYGNFKFSLPLSDLLSEYKEQHCQGAEPEFRVLGTAMYKQEIAHIVLVHSPMATEFSDLPSVPIVGGNANPLPFVFRSQEDGKLIWRPESTSIFLKMKISEKVCSIRKCKPYCTDCDDDTCGYYGDNCVWNELILAFHLPGNEPLRIPREKLLESLSGCDILEPYLREEETRLRQEGAQDIIRSLKAEPVERKILNPWNGSEPPC